MKIFLHEITDQESEFDFTQENPWVLKAVERVDEPSDNEDAITQPRSIQAHFSLRKVDDVIVVSGKIETFIQLVCSRCATPFQHFCQPQFSALFCKDPIMAGVAHLQKPGKGQREYGRPVGQNHGFARHAHDADSDEASAEGKDLDITYLSHEYIELDDVLTEQLQFQVPFQPLCKEDCLGICSNCGTDLNFGRCACNKLRTAHPFSVLQNSEAIRK